MQQLLRTFVSVTTSALCMAAFLNTAITLHAQNIEGTEQLQTKEVSLRYALKVGSSYTWRLAADQAVVGGRAARINAMFSMETVDKDDKGNTLCRIRVRSDHSPSIATLKLNSDENLLAAVADRRLSLAGVYDAILDELGNVITGKTMVNQELEQATLSGAEITNNTQDIQNNLEIPSLMNMVVPSIPTFLGKRLDHAIDTIFLPSRNQRLTQTRLGQKISTEEEGMLMDTVFRDITLDSIRSRDQQTRLYITINSERHNISGQHFISKTSVIKDVNSGLVEQIIEYGYRKEEDKLIPEYSAAAVLEKVVDENGKVADR